MLSLVAQLLVAVAASMLTLYALGVKMYAAVAILMAIVSAGLLVNASHAEDDDDGMRLFSTLIVSALFGAAWPMLPIAFAWGSTIKRGHAIDDDEDDDGPPLSGTARP